MSDPEDTAPAGPVEAGTWPEKLTARVASPSPGARIQGFDVLGDLAAHYNFGEFVVVALTGQPPTQAVGHAVNAALIALGAVSIAEAPVHAASLARLGGAPASVVLATGMMGLAEQAEHQLSPKAPSDAALTSEDLSDAAVLRQQLPAEVQAALPPAPASVHDVALAVLHHAGLNTPMQQTAALCLARLPALAAEAAATPPGALRSYPMRLPDFAYTEDSA